MNTSAKGRAYENAFKAELYRRGARLVMRAAGSKGPFDLLAIEADAVCAYQLKSRTTCSAAHALAVKLIQLVGTWPNCLPYVVHPTSEEKFCVH